MALTTDSLARAARRKSRSAQDKIRAAEEELLAANEALQQAIPRRDVDAITQAAERTAVAEDEVREAAHDLEVLDELLGDQAKTPRTGNASGEGVGSLLRHLKRAR